MNEKTKKVECSNMSCFRGTVEVRGALTPQGDPVTEICPICRGDSWIEVPDETNQDHAAS